MDYKELRTKYPEFYYKSYKWKIVGNNLSLSFQFSAGEYIFNPKIVFKDIDIEKISKIGAGLDNLVFSIGMVELLSYWKAFCSPKIIIESGRLDDYQIKWWHDLLMNGMGQFFYENKIDFSEPSFVSYVSSNEGKVVNPINITSNKILVPVGGGKDSSVTIEILSNNFDDVSAFLLNPSKASIETVKLSGSSSLIVKRELDSKIFELNEKGFLNGHTPFTTFLSFCSILSGVIGNFGTVAFSNERSSDEENVNFNGVKINQQYSKNFDFENKFREYNKRYLSNINYFSFLRPLYDIQIAKIFSKFNKYFSVIRSCNVGQKTDSWCGKCPKCLSTFILFYPFLKEETLKMFGKNLLEDKDLEPLLKALTNDQEVKPFECVGTRHELRVALGIDKDEAILSSWNTENNLPEEYETVLKKYV